MPEAEAGEVWDCKTADRPAEVAERVRTRVTERGGIGQLATPDAVKQEYYNAGIGHDRGDAGDRI